MIVKPCNFQFSYQGVSYDLAYRIGDKNPKNRIVDYSAQQKKFRPILRKLYLIH